MSRLHQKCVLASAGTHGLLALILLTCPAFLTSKSTPSEVTPITIYPDLLIDQNFSNPGGSPGNLPPAPPQAPPAPVVQPRPVPPSEAKPQPIKAVTPPKTTDDSVEVAKPPTKPKPAFSPKPVTRMASAKPTPPDTSAADAQERAERDWRERAATALDHGAGRVRSGTASPTAVAEGRGSGNSGPSYASYRDWVWSYYESAWGRPEDATLEDATVEVSVTIASDGSVIAKRITRRSGDRAVDASIQSLLDRVTTVKRSFPEGAKDKQRTFTIPFNMKTHRGTT